MFSQFTSLRDSQHPSFGDVTDKFGVTFHVLKLKENWSVSLKSKHSSFFFFKLHSVFGIIWEGICMDRFDCTVSIPIKFENRNIIYAEGNPIPILFEIGIL